MKNGIFIAVLVAGTLLLAFGIIEYQSTGSDLSRFFTGSATDKSIWMLIAGAVAIVLGIVGLSRGSKHS